MLRNRDCCWFFLELFDHDVFDDAVGNHFRLGCQGDQLLESGSWEALGRPQQVTITIGNFAEQTPETDAQTREFLTLAEQPGTIADQWMQGREPCAV